MVAIDHQGAPQQGEPEPGGEPAAGPGSPQGEPEPETTRRRRIRSAVRQLSFEAGGEDATSLVEAREAAFVKEKEKQAAEREAERGADESPRRVRLDSLEAAGFSPQSSRLWSFDRETEEELMEEMLLQLAEMSGLPKMSALTVHTFVGRVAGHYSDEVDFHSFTHAVDVTLSAFLLLTRYGGREHLQPVDAMAILVAAMCHDAGHPGLTNPFQKATQSELVSQYGEEATLERMHISIGQSILRSPGCNVLDAAGFSAEEQAWASELIEFAVLGTDLSTQSTVMAEWAEMFGDGGSAAGAEGAAASSCLCGFTMDEAARKAVGRLLLKTADLGCCAKPWAVAQHWAERLVRETQAQTAKELELLVDTQGREAGSPVAGSAGAQAKFHQYVVTPIFRAAAAAFPAFSEGLEQALENERQWRCAHPLAGCTSSRSIDRGCALTLMMAVGRALSEAEGAEAAA